MNRVSDITARLGGNAVVSRKLGIKPSAVSEMKRRNSIPPKYWAGLIAMAQGCGDTEITAEGLVAVHSAPADDAGSTEVAA